MPLLCLTKPDLTGPEELLETYGALAVPHVVVHRGAPLDELVARLADRVSVFVGHSGVGKSTLVNALIPGAGRATGGVNAVTGRGRHTSSSVIALELPGGGWVIDTPGVRSFGLAHVDLEPGHQGLPGPRGGHRRLPRGCSHDEPECALDAWVAAGHSDPARLASLRRLLRSRDVERDDDSSDSTTTTTAELVSLLAGAGSDRAAPDRCRPELARDGHLCRGSPGGQHGEHGDHHHRTAGAATAVEQHERERRGPTAREWAR